MEQSPSTDEGAAIAAALERFLAETAPAGESRESVGPWQRAALAEGVAAKAAVAGRLREGAKWLS